MIIMCFLILPFTYFYAEEALESDEDIDFIEDDFSDDEVDSAASTKAGAKTRKGSGGDHESKVWDRVYKASR
jgi:hypothetical protein